MKILFVGDKQHVHNCLADALKRMGHTVTVASTEKSGNIPEGGINLRTPNGLFGSATLLARVLFSLPRMKGYDVVEITGTYFLDLPLSMVLKVYNFLRKHNKKVVISALDTDFYYVKTCYEGMQLRYNEYFYNNRLTPYSISHKKETQKWRSTAMKNLAQRIARTADGIIACMPELYSSYIPPYPTKTFYINLPAPTTAIQPAFIEKEPEKVTFLIVMQKGLDAKKGRDILLETAKSVCQSHPDKAELIVKEQLTHDEYCACINSAHVVLDQIYSLTPSPEAILAMTYGRIAVSGAEPEYYDFLNELENQPIINVQPDTKDITEKLEWIIANKHALPEMSLNSRKFVEKYNDSEKIAQQYLDIWNKI